VGNLVSAAAKFSDPIHQGAQIILETFSAGCIGPFEEQSLRGGLDHF